jgi:beta-mannosidase
VTSDAVAPFVTLTSLAQGRFSDNAFLALPGTTTIRYVPFVTPTDIDVLATTTRIEHMATYAFADAARR